MTLRKPLVRIAGRTKELPASDTLDIPAGANTGYPYTARTSGAAGGGGGVRYSLGVLTIDDVASDGQIGGQIITHFADSTNASKGYVTFKNLTDPSNTLVFEITGDVDTKTGGLGIRYAIPATLLGGTFTDAEDLLMSFSRTGDVGATGATTVRAGAVAYTSALTVDVSAYDHIRVGLLTGNITALNFTGGTDGQRIVCLLQQDGTGGRTVALGSSIILSADLPSFVASTGPTKVDLLAFIYDGTLGKYLLTAVNKGY